MHFRWSFIFSTYGLYFLPGSNFALFEEGKGPVSNSAKFFQKSAPWRILEELGWSVLISVKPKHRKAHGHISALHPRVILEHLCEKVV